MSRFYRSTREAFPAERFYAVEVYRTPLLARVWRLMSWVLFLSTFALLGFLLAFRG